MRRNATLVVSVVLVSVGACGSGGPSQEASAAVRDGVLPEIAELALSERADLLAEVETPEGTWAIATPGSGTRALAEGCRIGAEDGKYPMETICTDEYGEILLINGSSIERAYPLAAVPPETMLVTDDAIYCARDSALPMPDSMVCRIDRQTLEIRVMVFADPVGSLVDQPCFYPPASWSVVEGPVSITSLEVSGDVIVAHGSGGAVMTLDAVTLEPIDSG